MKNEYLEELKRELESNNIENKDEIYALYESRFELGYEANMTDEEIIQSLESISDIIEKYKNNNNENSQLKKFNVSLELSVFSDFNIVRTNQNGITFDIEERALTETEILVEGKNITLKSKGKSGGLFRNKNGRYEGTMFIGDSVFFDKLNINLFTCDLESCNLKGNELDISSISGDTMLKELKFDSVKLKTTSGDFEIDKINTKDLILTSVSGDCVIDFVNINNCKITTVSGDLIIKNSNDAPYSISTVSGDVRIDSGVRLENVKASSVTGDVFVGSGKASKTITDQLNDAFSKIKF